ncbi:MAG: IS1595 family transposase [Gammaproteobacteria bacterium]|nr:MAG: IS1595 family transposase [Gammaproteobacteria bacterium]
MSAHYCTEAQCAQAWHAWRWPEGFVCPGCGYARLCRLGRGLLQCHRRRRQPSLTSGTRWPAALRGYDLGRYDARQRQERQARNLPCRWH